MKCSTNWDKHWLSANLKLSLNDYLSFSLVDSKLFHIDKHWNDEQNVDEKCYQLEASQNHIMMNRQINRNYCLVWPFLLLYLSKCFMMENEWMFMMDKSWYNVIMKRDEKERAKNNFSNNLFLCLFILFFYLLLLLIRLNWLL